MRLRRLAGTAAMAAILAAAPAAVLAAPPTEPAAGGFEGRVAAAKTAIMMGDPQAALGRSTEAFDLARKATGARQAERIATAQWLQGEALMRLNRLDEAAVILDQGLATAAAKAPNTKPHADLLMARA